MVVRTGIFVGLLAGTRAVCHYVAAVVSSVAQVSWTQGRLD